MHTTHDKLDDRIIEGVILHVSCLLNKIEQEVDEGAREDPCLEDQR